MHNIYYEATGRELHSKVPLKHYYESWEKEINPEIFNHQESIFSMEQLRCGSLFIINPVRTKKKRTQINEIYGTYSILIHYSN